VIRGGGAPKPWGAHREGMGRREESRWGRVLAVGVGPLGGEGQPAAMLASCFCVVLALCEVLLAGAVREEVCCT
jgi:hypothetical protein